MKLKHIFICLTIISLFGCAEKHAEDNTDAISKNANNDIDSDTLEISAIGKYASGLMLSEDSGFILKKDGLRFLVSVSMTDTADSFWSNVMDNDTVGQFYRVRHTDNFYICIVDLSKKYSFETHLLFEIEPNGTVLRSERFFHGNYSCCWNNYYEGFYRCGEFFCLKTCGTGSGYCATHVYFFKDIKPQDQQNSIVESYWSSFGDDGNSQNLSSTIEWDNKSLIMHYELVKGIFDHNNSNFEEKHIEKFDVQYILQNNIWVVTDSASYNKLGI